MIARFRWLYEWLVAAVVAVVIVLILHFFVFVPTQVVGPSMQPNFENGQHVIVDRWAYWFSKPQRGDVIVFHAPSGEDYIKRVIGLPGEKVRVQDDHVYINGQELREHYIEDEIAKYADSGGYNNRNYAEAVVPEGTVFVMGDNRRNSSDSRSREVGPVPYGQIVGRADLIIWPLTQIQLISHGDVEVAP